MGLQTNGEVAPSNATESRSGNPTPDRQPATTDGMNDAVSRMLAAKGITPAPMPAASAAEQPEAEASEADLSQSQEDESGSLAAAPDGVEAEDQVEGEDQAEAVEAEEGEQEDAADDAPKGVQKRINKLTARAKAAEEQVEQLRQEIEQLKAQRAEPEAPAAGRDPELEALNTRLASVREEISTAEQLRAQLATDAEGVAEILKRVAKLPNYEPQTMRDFLTDYLSDARSKVARVEGEIGARAKVAEEQAAAKRTKVVQLTEAEMPWVKDSKDPRAAEYRRIMALPATKAIPDAAFFVAAGVEKILAMQARAKTQAAKPKAAAAATVRPVARASGAPAKPAAKDPLQVARDGLQGGGRDAALAYAKAAVAAARQ